MKERRESSHSIEKQKESPWPLDQEDVARGYPIRLRTAKIEHSKP